MSKVTFLSILGVALFGATIPLNSGTARADNDSGVEVTVTNLTRGQIISPVVVASHRARFEPLFVPGERASAELAAVAEDADLDPLIAALTGDSDVLDVQVLFGPAGPMTPIMPGKSASIVIDVDKKFRFLSMAGMLVTTNDAFFALRGARIPSKGSRTFRSPAYDAGSEANTEDCAHIPGPPCGNGGVRVLDGAEGYVHIHAGIHGIADPDPLGYLDPAAHDWRNPVAEITIKRLSDD